MSKYTPTKRLDIYQAMIALLLDKLGDCKFICVAMERVCEGDIYFTSDSETFRFMRDNLPELWSVRPMPKLRGSSYVIEGDLVLRLWFSADNIASRVKLLRKAIKLVVV